MRIAVVACERWTRAWHVKSVLEDEGLDATPFLSLEKMAADSVGFDLLVLVNFDRRVEEDPPFDLPPCVHLELDSTPTDDEILAEWNTKKPDDM